jgi:hypothetical protein
VTAPPPDARRPGPTNRFGHIQSLPVGITDRPEDFYRFVFGIVLDHEAAEFVLGDGSRPVDPPAGAGTPPGRS